MTKIALSIAGLDPSGGAGVLADVRTFAAFGVFPAAVVTSITFQNTQAVYGAEHVSAASIRKHAIPVFDDFVVSALKTGMLPTREVIEEVARIIKERDVTNVVVDPVVRSTSGYDLIDDKALRSLIEQLFPLADVITPNVPEAERISGVAIRSESDLHDAASVMLEQGARKVLIKGGHLKDKSADIARDHLFTAEGKSVFEAPFYETGATHGTGCTLSSAIAANLALGFTLTESIATAKRFVNEAIRTAPGIGHGSSPINIKAI